MSHSFLLEIGLKQYLGKSCTVGRLLGSENPELDGMLTVKGKLTYNNNNFYVGDDFKMMAWDQIEIDGTNYTFLEAE